MSRRSKHTEGGLSQLQQLALLQQQTDQALLALAGTPPPERAYEHYFSLARRLVAGVADLESRSPSGFDMSTFARPLVQQLSIYADYKQAAGDRKSAKRLRHESDELTRAYLDATASAAVLRDRAMQAAMEGRFHDALIGLADASEAFARAGVTLDKVHTDLQVANVYEWLGDYERALAVVQTAHRDVADRLEGGPPSAAEVEAALGRQFRSIVEGDSTREGEEALTLRSIAYELIQAEARTNRYLGNYDAAERLFREARPFAEEYGVVAGIDFHLAVIALGRGDLASAERLLRAITPAFDYGLIRPRRGALRQVQADFHLTRNEPEQALAAAADGLSDQLSYPDLDLAWKLQWRRARALLALGRAHDAVSAFRSGMSSADRLRMAPLGYRLDTTFVRDKLPMAHEAVDAALKAGDAPAVASFIELVKSRALAATISLPRVPAAGRTPEEARFDALSQEIDALAFAQHNGAEGVLQRRDLLIGEREDVLERIRIRDPRWRTMTEPAAVDPEEIRTRLGPARAALVLQYRSGPEPQVIAALIDATGIVAGARMLTPATTSAITRFAKNLRTVKPNEDLFDLSAEEDIGLEDLLSPDILERLTAARTLVIVPHGLLHLLPWACLTVGSRRLFQSCAVGILPNLACLPLLDQDLPVDPMVALIGAADYSGWKSYDTVAESPGEIATVAGIYSGHVVGRPATERHATEQAFWALAEAAEPHSTLHFSGHGRLDAEEPLASGLVLAESIVDAAELLTRRLPYDEVVLSACSTAWRPQSRHDLELSGDDALGLPASFLEAGTNFLLASVPPIRAKVARNFTVAWHRHRHAGQSPLEAYRSVQLDAFAAAPQAVWAWAGMTAYGCR